MGWGVHDYPSPHDPDEVICPICGFDARTFYRNLNGEIIGCDQCVEEIDSVEWLAEQKEMGEIEREERRYDG